MGPTRTEPVVLVADGDVTGEAAAVVQALIEGPAPIDLLLVHERDAQRRWANRSSTFAVRDRPLPKRLQAAGHPAAAARVTNAELRSWLWRRRRRDLVLVGHDALRAAPFLARHRGQRVALLTVDDESALRLGHRLPATSHGGPHVVVPWDELQLTTDVPAASDPRWTLLPGWTPRRAHATATSAIVALGPPDRAHGVDLAGRVLHARAEALRARGASLHWLAPAGATMDPEDHLELDRLGVADLFQLVPVPHDRSAVLARGAGAAALLAVGRPGAGCPPKELLRAHRLGLHVVAHDLEAPPVPGMDQTWHQTRFGETTALADALVRSIDIPRHRSAQGPVGTAGLLGQVLR